MHLFLSFIIGGLLGLSAGYSIWQQSESKLAEPTIKSNNQTKKDCTNDTEIVRQLKEKEKECIVRIALAEKHITELTQKQGQTKPAKMKSKPLQDWAKYESNIFSADSEVEIMKAVAVASINNFKAELNLATTAKLNEVRRLIGQFEGEILLDKSGKRYKVQLHFKPKPNTRKITGLYIVNIFNEKGGNISAGKSEGAINQSFLKFPGNNQALIITDGSPTGYFQLYSSRNLDGFVGNYYEKNSETDEYDKIGFIQLSRLN